MTERSDSGVPDTSEGVAAEMRKRFSAISEMYARGTDADELVGYLNWPDSIVVGEGTPLLRNRDELLPIARPFVVDMGRDVEFSICAPVLAAGNLASCLALITCRYPDRPAVRYYALYNWQQRGGEWKVVREMLCGAVPALQ